MKDETARKNQVMDTEQEAVRQVKGEAEEPEMRAHYSFKGGQRGRYAHLFPSEPHLVMLSPDMAAVFPDSDSVNEALRTLVKVVRRSVPMRPEHETA